MWKTVHMMEFKKPIGDNYQYVPFLNSAKILLYRKYYIKRPGALILIDGFQRGANYRGALILGGAVNKKC